MEEIVLPGDIIVKAMKESEQKKVILGPGIRYCNEKVVSYKAGILQDRNLNSFWVDNYQKRYIPIRGDEVIGVVIAKTGDIYRVDIGAQELAMLSYMAFEGATKKNRPNISIGDLVYAKIIVALRDLEPELVCVDSFGKKGKLGILSNGFVFNCSLNLSRKLLKPNCKFFMYLKREMPYEIAIGLNGRVWVSGFTTRETIAIGNAIAAAEFEPEEEIPKLCEKIGYMSFNSS